MAQVKSIEAELGSSPPCYFRNSLSQPVTSESSNGKSSRKSTVLIGYSVAATTALIVVLIMGGVYYYRSLDIIQETIKNYKILVDNDKDQISQDVEVNAQNQYITFRLNRAGMEPGTFAVLDYAKSMTGIYEPRGRQCFLIGGIKSEIADLQTLSNVYDKTTHLNSSAMVTYHYVLADTYPVSDKKILPVPLQNACTSLPVYWLEPAQTAKTHNIQKRDFWDDLKGQICYEKFCITYGK